MNKFLAGLLIVVTHFALSFYLPWWTIIFISFIAAALFKLRGVTSWLIPAVGMMISWMVQILILDKKTNFRSSQRIADIFEASGIVSYIIPMISIAIVAGLSGYLAYLILGTKEKVRIEEQEENMTIDEYKENTPGLEDKGII